MKIKTNATNITDYIAYQKALKAHHDVLQAKLKSQTEGETLSSFKKLQYKAALFQETRESGFLPKLESKLAMALTAMNSNEKAAQQSTPKVVYSRPTELDIES